MANTIKLRRGTSAQWSAANPILSEGEFGVDTTVWKFKIGDGATAWNSLNWAVALPEQTGNAGLYLTTDGTSASWAIVESGLNPLMLIGA